MKIIRAERPQRRLKIRRTPQFWSVHTHSMFSAQDALPSVDAIVKRAHDLGQPAIGLTDHGNMAGSVQLYAAAKKYGMKPFPGTELYLVDSIAQHRSDYKNREVKASRFHLGVVAFSTSGYHNLVRLNTLAHAQHFHKPLVDLASLADFAYQGYTQGLAVTTGCYFSKCVQGLVKSGPKTAEAWLRTLDTWFPNATYVEIQNHHIDHGDGWNDSAVADSLVSIADELGLPVVITQDAHYVMPEEKVDHDALKRLVAFGDDVDEAVFPGDGFHLADDEWINAHHEGRRRERGYEGLKHLYDRHDLSIRPLDSYSYAVPLPVSDPDAVLRQRCMAALLALGLTHTKQVQYISRMTEELDVIKASGFAGYLLLAADVTDHCREVGIIFQTRGSAGGSLCNYLLGITSADPIKWNLRFERFLSKDRTKPPDIDLDIEHERRGELITWLSAKYAVNQIGTWAELSLNGDEETSKGSLLVKYFATARKVEGGATTWSEVPPAHRAQLNRLNDFHPFSGPGTNAAGLAITSTKAEFDALVPQMYMSDSKANGGSKMLSQYDKDDIEKLGLVKLDVMGLKTLTVLSRTLKAVGLELNDIPLTDKQTYSFIKTGQTEGTFQLSGHTTARGLRDLKPTKIQDVIAAMALFRPATMKSGATEAYIRRKHRLEPVPQRHQIIDAATKETFGILLYQEQVIEVLRELGMGADDLTAFLKAVKASNKDIGGAGNVIAGYMSHIHDLSVRVGMTETDMVWLQEALDAYSGYGFNSSHATIYGITAYRSAYLVVHHPLEFHAALLGVYAGVKDKEHGYLMATRRRGIKILSADINTSGYTYSVDGRRGAIRKGLLAIPGVGKVAAAELIKHQPYTDLKDLCERVDHRKITGVKNYRLTSSNDFTGVLLKLYDAGALDSIL